MPLNLEELLERVAAWAAGRPDVRAAFLIGSHARGDAPADEFSDVDVVLLADDPVPVVDDGAWVAGFGEPLLTFVEETAVGGQRERRVLYADGTEVDFAVFPAAAAAALARDPDAETWHGDRFAERWADPRALTALWLAARAPQELPGALRGLCDAFDELAGELAALDAAAPAACARLEELLA